MRRTINRRPEYVEQIGRNLLDVPWPKRQALLDDVATHLGDAGLPPEDPHPWAERFGPADDYATQLRDDLGLATDPASLRRGRRHHLRHARRRTQTLVGAVVVVGGLVLGAALWLRSLQPLTLGDRITAFGGETTTAGGHDEHRWSWVQGEQLAAGTWMRNDGPLPVRITAISVPEHLLVPWDRWRVELSADEHRLDVDGSHPFEPFTLEPGERQLVWIRGDFLRCPDHYAAGTSAGHSSLDVTFEVLGVERHETLDLGFTYSVQIPETGCGDPEGLDPGSAEPNPG